MNKNLSPEILEQIEKQSEAFYNNNPGASPHISYYHGAEWMVKQLQPKIRIAFIDACREWLEVNNKERIPISALNDISKKAIDLIGIAIKTKEITNGQ
jgi:hypothetical protein